MTERRRERRWAELFTVGFGTAIFVGGTQQALRGVLSGTPWNWAEMALYVLLWTAILPPIWSMAGRVSVSRGPVVRSRAELRELIASALKAGALPVGANPEFWRPALEDEARRWNALRWVSVGLAVVGGGLIAAAAVIANDNAWGVWAVAVLVVGEGLAACSVSTRRLHVARRLLAEVPAS